MLLNISRWLNDIHSMTTITKTLSMLEQAHYNHRENTKKTLCQYIAISNFLE